MGARAAVFAGFAGAAVGFAGVVAGFAGVVAGFAGVVAGFAGVVAGFAGIAAGARAVVFAGFAGVTAFAILTAVFAGSPRARPGTIPSATTHAASIPAQSRTRRLYRASVLRRQDEACGPPVNGGT